MINQLKQIIHHNNGFTLVELLAVIAILGIILTLTVPKIVDVVNESKMNTFKTDVKLVLQKLSSEKMKDETIDFTDVTLDVLTQNLGIRSTNYASIKIKDVGGKPFVIVSGKEKWDGYTAYGTYENVKVVLSNTFTENNTAPTVSLVGDETLALSYGAIYTEQGITYSDDIDTSDILANNIIIQGEVNTQKYGTYTLTYYVYDSSGNVSSTIRTINITSFAVEYLVVAGGGGGGGAGGGGGGAGGFKTGTMSLPKNSYSVIVGNGGTGATGLNTQGADGGASTFYTITSIGGGGGGSSSAAGNFSRNGRTGGSGGGAAGGGSTNGIYGLGTVGQGSNGGNGSTNGSSYDSGGGGGGANTIGISATLNYSGNGGDGLMSGITGTNVAYAGGGGGGRAYDTASAGLGGTGGGGAGSKTGSGSNGTANTGGGGGGSALTGSGGNGGSGIIIIAYPGTSPRATGGTISTTSRPGYVVHTFTSSGTFTVN